MPPIAQLCSVMCLAVCGIGVARIISGSTLFLPEKVDDLFLVVALKTHAKTTKLTPPTVLISPIS